MITQNKIVNELLDFYYLAYGKLISFPFLYYELLSSDYEIHCMGSQTDFSTCKCCAMKQSDLRDLLNIIGNVNMLDFACLEKKYPCKRLPENYLSRKLDQTLDVSYLSKEIDMLISQLYIICLIMTERDSNIDPSITAILSSSFRLYVYEIRKRIAYKFSDSNFFDKTEVCEEVSEEYKAILNCLDGEIPTIHGSKRTDNQIKLIRFLSEAMHSLTILHNCSVHFSRTFSQHIYVIREPNRTGFENLT